LVESCSVVNKQLLCRAVPSHGLASHPFTFHSIHSLFLFGNVALFFPVGNLPFLKDQTELVDLFDHRGPFIFGKPGLPDSVDDKDHVVDRSQHGFLLLSLHRITPMAPLQDKTLGKPPVRDLSYLVNTPVFLANLGVVVGAVFAETRFFLEEGIDSVAVYRSREDGPLVQILDALGLVIGHGFQNVPQLVGILRVLEFVHDHEPRTGCQFPQRFRNKIGPDDPEIGIGRRPSALDQDRVGAVFEASGFFVIQCFAIDLFVLEKCILFDVVCGIFENGRKQSQ
jgi:hypothetical protein